MHQRTVCNGGRGRPGSPGVPRAPRRVRLSPGCDGDRPLDLRDRVITVRGIDAADLDPLSSFQGRRTARRTQSWFSKWRQSDEPNAGSMHILKNGNERVYSD